MTGMRKLRDTTQATPKTFNGNWNFQCNKKKQHLQFYSMDLHPSREMVASGQRAGRNRKTQAHIRIWSTETLQTLYVFGMGEFEVGVAAVAFSQLVGDLQTAFSTK